MKKISDEFKALISSAPEFILLLTVYHPDLADPILLTNCHKDIESQGRKFMAFPINLLYDGELLITWSHSPISLTAGTSIKVTAEVVNINDPDDPIQLFQQVKLTVTGNIARGHLPIRPSATP